VADSCGLEEQRAAQAPLAHMGVMRTIPSAFEAGSYEYSRLRVAGKEPSRYCLGVPRYICDQSPAANLFVHKLGYCLLRYRNDTYILIDRIATILRNDKLQLAYFTMSIRGG
jgi:hypothetical protein